MLVVTVVLLTLAVNAAPSNSFVTLPDNSEALPIEDDNELPPYDYYDSDEYYDQSEPNENFGAIDDYGIVTDDAKVGYVLIAVLGYVLPLACIVFGFIMFLRSRSKRRAAWLISVACGLATSLLATVFRLITM